MINDITLVGQLIRDPDLRYTASGTTVTTLTLVVNRNFMNQNGNREADFVNCVIRRKPAETIATLAKKGSLIGIVERIQTRTCDNQQRQHVYVTEVVADNSRLLESKATTESRAHVNRSSSSLSPTAFERRDVATPNNSGLNALQNPFGGQSIGINDDDLPF